MIRQGRVVALSATALGSGTVTLGDGSTAVGALELFIDPIGAGSNITMTNAINIGPVAVGTTAVIGTLFYRQRGDAVGSLQRFDHSER